MSNQCGNEQALAYSHPENAENDKQQQKKPLTAFVQIVLAGQQAYGPVKVELDKECSTVAEQAAFMLRKINESQGNLIGLQLNCPVELAAVSKEDVFMLNHNVPLEMESKYTFKFKLANFVWTGQEQGEDLGKQVAQLAREKEALKKKVDEQAGKLDEGKRIASAEYARQIGVPNVANLKAHYNKEKLLQMIEHGAMPSVYIQSNQQLNDEGIVQSIVDKLATAEKPKEMVGQVTIEAYASYFTWPKRKELKLEEKKSNVTMTLNEASASPSSHLGRYLAEYELSNRGSHFQVLIHYWEDSHFNKSVHKFICRRLP